MCSEYLFKKEYFIYILFIYLYVINCFVFNVKMCVLKIFFYYLYLNYK